MNTNRMKDGVISIVVSALRLGTTMVETLTNLGPMVGLLRFTVTRGFGMKVKERHCFLPKIICVNKDETVLS